MPDPNTSSSIVANILREVLGSVVTAVITEVRARMGEHGIAVDPQLDAMIRSRLGDLQDACRSVIEEWDKAEARGRARPLGGGLHFEVVDSIDAPTVRGTGVGKKDPTR